MSGKNWSIDFVWIDRGERGGCRVMGEKMDGGFLVMVQFAIINFWASYFCCYVYIICVNF